MSLGFGRGLASLGPAGSSNLSSTKLTLTDDVMSSYKMGVIFKGSEDGCITSLDFHKSGEFCVSTSRDGVLNLYNVPQGRLVKTVYSKQYGSDIVRYTHHTDSIIYSSRNEHNDHRVRYHSLFDNSYIRYFQGHTDRVVAMSMNACEDSFITAAMDYSVKLWDLRQREATASLQTHGRPCADFDPTGVAFAAVTGDGAIRLYDVRQYERGPFDSFRIDMESVSSHLHKINPELTQMPMVWQWAPLSLKFSPDGAFMLIGTDRAIAFQLDAFTGNLVSVFTGFQNENSVNMEASYSPDARYVIGGSTDKNIYVWSAKTGKLITRWEGHVDTVRAVRWNPINEMVASGGTNVVFWLPDLGK